jgi:hypothetical protein
MGIISLIGIWTAVFIIAVGVFTMLRERGYRFDLRRGPRRRDDDRVGGRRNSDYARAKV